MNLSLGPSGEGRSPADQPLAGVRIADFTFQGAGAYATMLLGALGAEIIKIESSRRPDPTRGRENRPYLHSLLFDDVNQGKRSIAIDMKTPGGLELAREVIGSSDAVMDNFRPGVMEAWGLTFHELRAGNPTIVVASLSAVGHEGPLHELAGYAGIFNAFSGLGDLTGYRDGPPTELRTSVDMRAGAFFAFSVVQGLVAARISGAGMRIDFSAAEAMTALSGEHLTAFALGVPPGPRQGNADEHYRPQGIFKCADGRWVCVSIRDDQERRALALLVRSGGDHDSDLEAALAEWIVARSPDEVEASLVDAGLSFGFVLDAEALANEAQHRYRNFFMEVQDATRRRTLAAAPWTFGGSRPNPSFGPDLGEDTDAVLTDLGFDEERIRKLHEQGVLR